MLQKMAGEKRSVHCNAIQTPYTGKICATTTAFRIGHGQRSMKKIKIGLMIVLKISVQKRSL
jgi:hypothetical protein